MTSSEQERVPSFFMLVPGPWQRPEELARALLDRGFEVLLPDARSPRAGELRVDIVEDDALAEGFAWGRAGPLEPELVDRIGECTHAALLEVGGRLQDDTPRLAKLAVALRDGGGVAIRVEASGAASSWESWLGDFQSGELARIYARCVLVVGDEEEMFTCGMQQFDLPDAQIAMDDPSEAIRWLDALCVYQLEERPALSSGHTFRPDADAARRVLEPGPIRTMIPMTVVTIRLGNGGFSCRMSRA
jgi:hypothetical protein